MSFEETELRLGLPGREMAMRRPKRGFDETGGGLKLNQTSSDSTKQNDQQQPSSTPNPPSPKGEVVGWPPIRSNRKNKMKIQNGKKEMEIENENGGLGKFVKVSVDGAPYLRKVDLSIHNSYKQLSHALANLFAPFTIRGMKDLMNDVLDGSDYVHTYQDKDGDWMLVGDVPWQMFVESCMRLRIMKGKDAIIGLAPRANEKCKNSKS